MTQPNNATPSFIREQLIMLEARFQNALTTPDPDYWLDNSMIDVVDAGPEVEVPRYPINLSAARYRAHEGEIIYRQMGEVSLDIKYGVWSDGVKAKVTYLMANPRNAWRNQPLAIARAARHLELEQAALALENGLTTASWDSVNFFSASHPKNILKTDLGTQSNLKYSASVGNTTLDELDDQFADMRGPDDRPLGLRLTGLLYPLALRKSWENLIKPQASDVALVAPDGEVNPWRWKGQIKGQYVKEFTQPTVYYALATNLPDIIPLCGMRKLAPQAVNMNTGEVSVAADEYERFIHDMMHPQYEKDGSVGIGYKKYWGARTAMHVGIIRCDTAAAP